MPEAFKLSRVPVDELLTEAMRRPDEMINAKGHLSDSAYALADLLGIRVCVDGAPVRTAEDGEPELMAIERQTGPYAGKLCLVGGGVGRYNVGGVLLPETVEQATRRHFRRDLGMEIEPITSWEQPQVVAQDMRPLDGGEILPGFLPNPDSRHLIAARFLVRITNGAEVPIFGETDFGQEANGIYWFGRDTMPDDKDFGYNHGDTYRKMFDAAYNLADRI